MIQNEFKAQVFEFIKSVSDFEEIISITLFGSVAKDEAKADSDIDFLVVVSSMGIEKKIIKTADEISDKFNKKLQVIVKTKKLEGLDPSMVESISADGILLYGVPIKVKQKDMELEPYTIAIYSLADLPQSEKMKFKRSLFGSESIFRGEKKTYKTLQEGLLKMSNSARLGRGAIIFPSKHREIIKQLEYFKAKFRTFVVYAHKDIVEWIDTFNESSGNISLKNQSRKTQDSLKESIHSKGI